MSRYILDATRLAHESCFAVPENVPRDKGRTLKASLHVAAEGTMIRGSCLCGGVKYRISGKLSQARYCHCSMCRKAHGTAFRARATVRAADFEWLQGENLMTFYESSPGNFRGFCRVCGSPILSKFAPNPAHYGLPLGALDDDPGVRPENHVYAASKAPWFTITDDLPQLPEGPT